MGTGRDELDALISDAAAALTHAAGATTAKDALPLLSEAQEQLTRAIDEAMAAAVLEEGTSLRQAGQLASLSENAVGPRLARTARLMPYATPEGRVTRTSVERARYDAEIGRPAPTPEHPIEPLRFRRRRDT
ncbi:MAG TPA: hypothetical protein PLF56_00860 [Micropruina sp.]|nr:hypothetical protein [Micropruina sp.]